MRIGVVDLGTNSTRLLVADVIGGRVTAELARDSRVTRLGAGVDASGELAQDAMDRVFAVLDDYRSEIDRRHADAAVAVLTSAARDAGNGEAFAAEVTERYGLDARIVTGAEEAQLTFLGATSERPDSGGRLAVIDIGGGSTEVVVGRGDDVSFCSSLRAGVVRQTERHFEHDPPGPREIAGLREEVAEMLEECVPADVRQGVTAVVAVAGTATSSAAIDLQMDPYDPRRTHGYRLRLTVLEALLDRLAALTEAERRGVTGLHPDRAPTIVAGVAMLAECAKAFGLAELEVSEHDLLRGVVLERARRRSGDRAL